MVPAEGVAGVGGGRGRRTVCLVEVGTRSAQPPRLVPLRTRATGHGARMERLKRTGGLDSISAAC